MVWCYGNIFAAGVINRLRRFLVSPEVTVRLLCLYSLVYTFVICCYITVMLDWLANKIIIIIVLLPNSSYYTHTHPFNGPFSGTTQVSRNQEGKTNLDFTEARDSEWQWHQLGHMQVCISLQTDNHASTPPLSFYRPDALPAAQPTASKH